MVHKAFEVLPVIEKLPQKIQIECIETYQDRLLMTSSDGTLLIYEIKQVQNSFSAKFQNAHKGFSRKPISQLSVVERHGILLSLSDGFINIHNLNTYQLRTQITKSKGCHMFALENKNEQHRRLMMAVAIKKSIKFFVWEGTEFKEIKEVICPDVPKTLTWCGDSSITIGTKKEYLLLSINSEKFSELFQSGGQPSSARLPNDTLLLGRSGVSEHISIFYGYDGNPLKKYGIPWPETPSFIEFHFPYVIGLLPQQGSIEIRATRLVSSSDSTLVQQIKEIKGKILVVNFDNIYIASSSQVWKLIPVPVENQIEQLLSSRQFEDAIFMCENLPPQERKSRVEQIKGQYSYFSFIQGNFERAMTQFKELKTDPYQVIGLFKGLLPSKMQSKLKYTIDIPDIGGAALDKALCALSKYLSEIRIEVFPDQKPKSELTPFDKMDYNLVEDKITIIDTCLLKAYTKSGDSNLAPLLRSPNFCHLAESEKWLEHTKKFYELVILKKGKGQHKEALEILKKHSAPNSLISPNDIIQYLKDLGKDHFNLITEYSKDILKNSQYQQKALNIFTASRKIEEDLPIDKTLNHIKSLAPPLVIPYLEHVIYNVKSENSDIHNELVYSYIEQANNSRTQLESYKNIRKKMITYLESPQAKYNPVRMLNHFPKDSLFEEKAILLGNLKHHEKVFEIYVIKLKNHEAAEKYCLKHYNPDLEDYRDVYLDLFKVYLEGEGKDATKALSLFKRYHNKMDLSKVLEYLPPTTPIAELQQVFEDILQENTKIRRNSQIIKNLLKSEHLQIKEKLIKSESGFIKIDDERVCDSCAKKLGNAAFALHSNGAVVHYGCQNSELRPNWESLNYYY